MAVLHVEVVAADRSVWSGEAALVLARTIEGELGILPGHTPLLGVLTNGVVTIRPEGDEDPTHVVVHGGFLSVNDDKVSVLAEEVELAADVDTTAARHELLRAEAEGDAEAARRARARLQLDAVR